MQNKIRSIVNQDLDWDFLIMMATKHHFRPLLYWQISQISPEQVPVQIMDELKEFFDQNTYKNLFILGKLFQILELLKHIEAVPYKGPILAWNAYDNLALREFDDLDIYVKEDDVSLVKDILTSNAYRAKLKLTKSQENHYIKSQREYKFFNEEKSLGLEIQWNLVGTSFSFPNESIYPVKETIDTEINQKVIKTFTNEDLLLVLSIHAAGHLWERLSWICDINELVTNNNYMDWDFIIEKASYLRVERILYLNICIANYLFGLEIPTVVENEMKKDYSLKKLAEDIINMVFSSSSSNILKKIILRYRIREDKIRGINDIWRILTIPLSEELEDLQKDGGSTISYIIRRPSQIIHRLRND